MSGSTNELAWLLKKALSEDIPQKDVTSELMVDPNAIITAELTTKEKGIFYGTEIITEIFRITDTDAAIENFVENGARINPGQKICVIKGNAKNILSNERVMLNFLQRLSGIATITNEFVQKLANPDINILDTRKTTPLLRFLEKRAVVAGGGANHRNGLSDMVLIKENHLTSFLQKNSPEELPGLFKKIRKEYPGMKIEIEIEDIGQLEEFDLSGVDYIMFDNFAIPEIKQGLEICKQKGYMAEIEISGNVTLDNIAQYRDIPIHCISVGSLTHSVKALDLSLVFL
ncbi:carboxylating nicotinate-nucleotide diphosphorylase [Candidatus Margulisiibacteriota bacterium]